MTRALLAGSFQEIKVGQRPMNLYGLGVIEDPGGGITLPGQVHAFVMTIDAAVSGLAQDIAASLTGVAGLTGTTEGRAFIESWSQYVDEWTAWRNGHSGTWASLWGSTNDQARGLADRYNGFEARFTELTGVPPSTPMPHHEPAPTANTFLGVPAGVWLGATVVVATLGFVAWGLNSAARVAAPMARARARYA